MKATDFVKEFNASSLSTRLDFLYKLFNSSISSEDDGIKYTTITDDMKFGSAMQLLYEMSKGNGKIKTRIDKL